MHQVRIPEGFSAFAKRFDSVAIDLDGTALLPDSTFSARTLSVFAECGRRGIPVIIVTGRSTAATEKFRKQLDSTGPMIYYNGAAVVDAPSGKVLAATLIPTEIVAGCYEISLKLGLHFQAFLTGDRLVCRELRPERDAYCARTGLSGEVVDFAELLSRTGDAAPSFIKCMFIADGENLELAKRAVDARFGTRVYRAKTTETFLEVMNNGVSKGNALGVALSLRGMETSGCVAFGDAENDLTLLQAAGWGVAMANADPDLKKKADDIALSNIEDGVADYIERLFAAHG